MSGVNYQARSSGERATDPSRRGRAPGGVLASRTGSPSDDASSGPSFKTPLFVATSTSTAVAAVVGISATPPAPVPGWALQSGVVYRIEIASFAFLVLYALVTLLWLAAHGQTLRGLTEGPASAEIPQATDEVEGTADAIDAISDDLRELTEAISEELAYHHVRLTRIENGVADQLDGGVPPPPGAAAEGEGAG